MKFEIKNIPFSTFGLVFSATLLFSLGLLMVYNTTSAEALDFNRLDRLHLSLVKQLIYGIIGIALSFFVIQFGYQRLYERVSFLCFFISLLLFLVLLPKIGMELNGARRWIKIMGISFQPSEFAKIIVPIFFIKSLLGKESDVKTFLQYLGIIFLPIFLILMEPDNGTAAIIIASLITIFFLMKIPLRYWFFPLMIFICLGSIFAVRSQHVHDRIRIYLHPEEDLLGKGHQPYQAKIAAGSGGVIGRGLGNSLQKLNYLPEARSDYIAAIFAEEFGFIGISFLIFCYLTFVTFGFQIAFKAPDTTGFLIAAFLTFLIGFQAFLNLGIVSGLLPSKGTNLPFFSQGGSSLCANILIVALLTNIDYISVKKGKMLLYAKDSIRNRR